MATKTFEELKQLAIQIRDEKTNKQNTATRVGTAMLEHINKLEQDYYDKTQTDEELKERDDKLTELGYNLESKCGIEVISIKSGTNTEGSNIYFKQNSISKRIAFKVIDTYNCVNKYSVITEDGIDIEYNESNFYRFEKNKWYVVDVPSGILESSKKFGCYVNSENAIGNGEITFVIEDYSNIEESLKTSFLLDGYNLVQHIHVESSSETKGSNSSLDGLRNNGEIAFCLIDKNGVVNKYSFVNSTGQDVENNSDFYRFEPNKIYFVNPLGLFYGGSCGCYINPENAVGTGDVTFVVCTNLDGRILQYIRQNQKEIHVHNSALGLSNASEFDVKLSANSESKNYPSNTFTAGKEYAFCLFTESTVVDKYAVITYNGQDIVGNSDFYRFEPNKIYTARPTSTFVNGITRCYINAANAIGNGKAVFVIAPCESFFGILQQLYDRTLSEEVIRLVGFDKTQKISVSKSKASAGSNAYFGAGSFVADTKIAFCLIDRNQTIQKYSFVSEFGLDIEANSDFYRYEPNKVYFANPTSYFVAQNTGCYIDAKNAIETGDVIFVVSTNLDGILSSLLGSQSSQFSRKTFAVPGDSLSETGIWQRKFEELTGAQYIAGYEKGGTATLDSSGNCGMDRVLRLKEDHPDIDVIFIQNINDGNYGESADGELTDAPYMMTKNYLSSKIYGTSSEATDALLTEVASLTPKIGAMVRLQYGTTAKKFTINNKATTNGNIFINIDGKQYGVEINTSMEIDDIQNAILAYDYSDKGYSDTAEGSNSILFSDTQNRGSSAPVVTINVGNTGINFTESDATTVNYVARCFISKNISEWNDNSKWVAISTIKRYSLYKGLFGWLIENFPTAQIFFLLLPRNAWGSSTPKLADGSYDFDKYRKDIAWNWLFECQRNIANYMGIPILDVAKECGITIYNCSTYYPEENVHPKNIGYERWGETVARIVE